MVGRVSGFFPVIEGGILESCAIQSNNLPAFQPSRPSTNLTTYYRDGLATTHNETGRQQTSLLAIIPVIAERVDDVGSAR